jgi:hypothetical protein
MSDDCMQVQDDAVNEIAMAECNKNCVKPLIGVTEDQ